MKSDNNNMTEDELNILADKVLEPAAGSVTLLKI